MRNSNVPYKLGEYYYYSRTEEGKQYPNALREMAADQAFMLTQMGISQ